MWHPENPGCCTQTFAYLYQCLFSDSLLGLFANSLTPCHGTNTNPSSNHLICHTSMDVLYTCVMTILFVHNTNYTWNTLVKNDKYKKHKINNILYLQKHMFAQCRTSCPKYSVQDMRMVTYTWIVMVHYPSPSSPYCRSYTKVVMAMSIEGDDYDLVASYTSST